MKLEECIKRIERYIQSNDFRCRIINSENRDNLTKLKHRFNIGSNIFINVTDYSKQDENPSMDSLLNDLNHKTGNIFLTGFTTHYLLRGKRELIDLISILGELNSTQCHVIILCYQCQNFLMPVDIRRKDIIYFVDGIKDIKPDIVFSSPNIPVLDSDSCVVGIEQLPNIIETKDIKNIYVITKKRKSMFPNSFFLIKEQLDAYHVLCDIDPETKQLMQSYGTNEQWAFLFKKINEFSSLEKYISNIFGNITNLELIIGSWKTFDENKKWLYFIALKMFDSGKNWCLSSAIKRATSSNMIVKEIFRCILNLDFSDEKFWGIYSERKSLLNAFANLEAETIDYCEMVKSKEKYALYYLTDSTIHEKIAILETLDRYGNEYDKSDLLLVLRRVYPDLYTYLLPYDFNNTMLNDYFQTYKYEKVINKILPEFMDVVNEQAIKREYNLILPTRSEKIENINKKNTYLYFVDALGVEYLSYILNKCNQNDMWADITVCRCELPSITSLNKDFIEVFEQGGATIIPDRNGIKLLDEIKHNGYNDCNYQLTSSPIHLFRELEIIEGILERIKIDLIKNQCERVVIISDHGSSRLSVISNQNNKWEMKAKGIHSGRCCPKEEIDEQPTCATEENGFWVLANYDRFKGSRKANVEVHGGATLEEIAVPIIEITYSTSKNEISILTPVIKFSIMKKNAVIKIFSKLKLKNVTVNVADKKYGAETNDGHNFVVRMPDLKKGGEYYVDIYSNHNKVASNIRFKAMKEISQEKELFN